MPSETCDIDKLPTALAGLETDVLALCDAALDGDLAEARFRAHLLARVLGASGHVLASISAAKVIASLGAPGAAPGPGLGLALIELADLLLGQLVVEA